MDEREGFPLLHQQRDAVREGADQLRAAHAGQRLDAGHRSPRIEAEEALPGSEPGGRDDFVGREQALPRDLDAFDSKGRRRQEPSAAGGEHAAQRDHEQARAEPRAESAGQPSHTPAPPAAVEPLVGHGHRQLGQIREAAAGGSARRENAAVAAHPSPMIRISGSSVMPNCAWTRSRAMSMSAVMSAAVAPPRLTMKLACLAEISAPLSRLPFRPTFSIRRPATSPWGFFHTQPADASASGWVAFFTF